jgi:alpha-glucosidase
MVFDYPEDKWTRRIEDQLIVGESIIIAPVLEKGKKGRTVYLPKPMNLAR